MPHRKSLHLLGCLFSLCPHPSRYLSGFDLVNLYVNLIMDYMMVRYCSEFIFVIVPLGKKTERSPMGHDKPNRALPKENTHTHLKKCPHGRFPAHDVILAVGHRLRTSSLEEKAASAFGSRMLRSQLLLGTTDPVLPFTGCSQGCAGCQRGGDRSRGNHHHQTHSPLKGHPVFHHRLQ